jgi:hypothetical protein
MVNVPPLRPSIIDGIGKGFTNCCWVKGLSTPVCADTTPTCKMLIIIKYKNDSLGRYLVFIFLSFCRKKSISKISLVKLK